MTYVNQEGAQLEAQDPGQMSKPKPSCSAVVKTRSEDDVKDVY